MAKKIIKITESQLQQIVKEVSSELLANKGENGDVILQSFLSELSEEELKQLWVDYRQIPHHASFENPLTTAMPNTIREGLIRTYPIEKTIQYIKSYFNLDSKQIMPINTKNGTHQIRVVMPVIGDNLSLMKRAMGLCGYYLGFPKEETIQQNTWVELQFEAKIQKSDSEQIRKEESTLLHLTPLYNLKKIMAIGLSPRSKNELFDFPNRVYFLRGSTKKKEIKHIGMQLSDNNRSEGNTGEYVLLKINLSKIPNDVELFTDPNYQYGVFTNSNIKRDAIVGYDIIKF